MSQASKKGAIFDDVMRHAKAWADKQVSKAEVTRRKRTSPKDQGGLSDMEQAAVIQELHNAFNQTTSEIAKLVNKSVPTVEKLLLLSTANHDVQKEVKSGSVSVDVAVDRVKEFGEKAGEVLQKDKASAAAKGKKKVTRSVIAPEISVKKARRLVELISLSIEQWKLIYESAGSMPPCAQNSMLLALVTGQRIGDIVSMKFSDIWDNHLHITQNKTGVKLAIPLNLRCDAIGMTLSDVISKCRDRVVSPYLIHHVKHHAYGKAGSHVPEKTISKYFKEARDKANIVWPKDCTALPPFHEQRSLSSRTYEAQGIDVKTLLGHKTEAMSAMYGDDRGLEWKKLVI